MTKAKCPKCGVELETIETRETLVYWDDDEENYRFAEAQCFPYCPECGAYIGDDEKIKEVLDKAVSP